MNKRHLHHIWRRFRVLKPWYFVLIAVISGVICILALRSNNQQMVKLRSAVYAADKDSGDVVGALNSLRAYVAGHMNTNLSGGSDAVYPPIQLKYTYDRLITAQGAAVSAQNTQVYTDAQHHCEQLYPGSFSGGPRVPCISEYVSSHGLKTAPIPDALYKFDFASPTWSPDLAGWSMFVSLVSLLTAAVLFIIQRLFKHLVS